MKRLIKKVYIETLGCSKNDVDSSYMISFLQEDDFITVDNAAGADYIIINTCGFIHDAKEESVEAILKFTENAVYNDKKIIAAGCLAQRYGEQLISEIPKLSGVIGPSYIHQISKFIDGLEDTNLCWTKEVNGAVYTPNNLIFEPRGYQFIKISEGCNNTCSYCIIPQLRGIQRSRSIESIVAEAKLYVESGTKEIILIAQNTSDYGIDLYGKYSLSSLIRKISELEGKFWIRILYLYPDHFTDDLIEEFKYNKKLLPYVDIPIQHSHDRILKLMRRNTTQKDIERLIRKLRAVNNKMVIRTTLLIGYPGENEQSFSHLKQFVKTHKFDKLGVFTYSNEEGTRAYCKETISEEKKNAWKNEIMEIQKTISSENLKKHIGEEALALIEEWIDSDTAICRSYMDAPDVDGVIYVSFRNTDTIYSVGEIIKLQITDSTEYDLIGEVIP